MKVRPAIAFVLISWTMIYTVPEDKSHPDGFVFQRGMSRYPTEAACKAAIRQAEAEWRKEGYAVDELGRNPASPLPRCVEHMPKP